MSFVGGANATVKMTANLFCCFQRSACILLDFITASFPFCFQTTGFGFSLRLRRDALRRSTLLFITVLRLAVFCYFVFFSICVFLLVLVLVLVLVLSSCSSYLPLRLLKVFKYVMNGFYWCCTMQFYLFFVALMQCYWKFSS